jgi:hypothetical protein
MRGLLSVAVSSLTTACGAASFHPAATVIADKEVAPAAEALAVAIWQNPKDH